MSIILVLYDDRQLAVAFDGDQDGALDSSLAFTAIFDQWGRDPGRAARPAAEALSEFRELIDYDSITTFFDAHGAYLGHVVIAHVIVGEGPAILNNPALVKNRALWARSSPNWLVHVEAVNGATQMIIRRLRNTLPSSVEKLSYVRRVRGDVVMGTWRRAIDAGSPPKSDILPLADYEREPFAKLRREKSERERILTLLSQDSDRPLSLKSVLHMSSWAYNLRQYAFLRDQSGLLVWAWCSLDGLNRMQRDRAEQPADVEWNSGNIPVLIVASGTTVDVDVGIRDWVIALPNGSEAPRRLVVDHLFNRYSFDLI